MLDSACCGIAGTYGFKRENYATSQAIGAPLFAQIEASGADLVVTDCETCKWQIEMSTGKPCEHPITLLARALANASTSPVDLFHSEGFNHRNPAVIAGDIFARQPAAQDIKRHHRADLLAHRQAVAAAVELHPQGAGAFRRRQRKVEVILFQPGNGQRQPGEMPVA